MALARSRVAAIGALRGQQAREVVGEDRAVARAGVEGLVVGDRPGEVAAGLAQAGAQEEEVAVRLPGRGDALLEGGLGRDDLALAGEEAEEREMGLGKGRGLGDQRPEEGLGLRVPALDRVEAGEEEAGREARGVVGERRLDGAAGLRRLAGGEAGADEVGEGLAAPGVARVPGRAPGREGLEHRGRVGGPALALEAGGVEARGHRRRQRIPLVAQEAGDLPGPGPVLPREVDAPEHVQELAVLGVAAERVDDDALGGAGAVLLHQEVGVAQRLRRARGSRARPRAPAARPSGRARRRARGRRP